MLIETTVRLPIHIPPYRLITAIAYHPEDAKLSFIHVHPVGAGGDILADIITFKIVGEEIPGSANACAQVDEQDTQH
jgi:hypothetical protein